MFLNLLDKTENQHFLNVAYHAMGLNGELKEEEQEIYHSFVHECNLHGYQAKTSKEAVDASIDAIAELSREHKNAIFIELFGILLADDDICEAERNFLDHLTDAFDYEDFEVKKIERWVLAMNDLVREGYRMVGV